MRNYFNYFTEIEEHFVRLRARNLLLSPLDWCLIESWKQSAIPLNVVLRGIDRSFEVSQKGGRKTPRTLFYCHPAVMEAFAEYSESQVGASKEAGKEDGAPEHSRVLNYLDLLIESVSGLSPRPEGEPQDEIIARVLERLKFLRDQVGADGVLMQEIDRELMQTGDLLTEYLSRQLPGPTLKEIKKGVTNELRAHRKRLGKEMYERLRDSYVARRLREHFGVPEFSILEV